MTSRPGKLIRIENGVAIYGPRQSISDQALTVAEDMAGERYEPDPPDDYGTPGSDTRGHEGHDEERAAAQAAMWAIAAAPGDPGDTRTDDEILTDDAAAYREAARHVVIGNDIIDTRTGETVKILRGAR